MRLFRDWRNWHYAPSGTAAEAADTDDGEITDDEVFGSGVEGETGDPEPQTEPSADPESQPAVKSWKDYGLDENPEAVATQLASERQRAQEYEQRARAYEQLLWQQQARQQLAENRVPQPEQPKAKLPWGDVPEFKREWVDLVMRDENGNLVAKPGAMPDLPQKISQYAQWREQAMDQLLRDPIGALKEQFAPIVQEQARQIAEQMFRENEERRALAEYDAKNRELFYDPQGNLNELGQHWNQVYHLARSHGFPNPIQVAHDAVDAALLRAHLSAEAQKAAQPQPPTAEAQRSAFLKKAANGSGATNRLANRTGSFPKNNGRSQPPQNPHKLWDEARKALAEIGEDAIKFGDE